MARDLSSRLRLSGVLTTESPLHVGGHGEDVDTDMPLARNGNGKLYIPGASLAGALRDCVERAFDKSFDKSFAERYWGRAKDDDDSAGYASFVVIEDALIEKDDDVVVEVRDGVGIDRQFGTAAEHIKYDRAVLPRGVRIKFEMAVEVANADDRSGAIAMLAELIRVLEAGQLRLGAAKTRGLGRVRLKDAALREQVFDTRRGVLETLRQPGGKAVSTKDIESARQAVPCQTRSRLDLTICWKPAGPLMVKSGIDGIAVDILPLASGIEGEVALVLPGSSVKGALRSHAERIVRTILGISNPAWIDQSAAKQKFLESVEVPLINELFGQRANREETTSDAAKKKPQSRIGALGDADCYGTHRLTAEQWQAIQWAGSDRELREALSKAGMGSWAQAYHVAIDRWLGSAAESMLYTVLEPHGVQWEPITVELDMKWLPQGLQWPALALIAILIRDVAAQRLPLGFATNRGMGSVEIESVEVHGDGLPVDFQQLDGLTLPAGQLGEMPQELRMRLNQEWEKWISQHRQEATV